MARAHVTTPQGITVKVEGTPAEILAVVQDLERKEKEKKEGGSRTAPRRANGGSRRVTLTGLLESLRDDGFFKQPRDLGSVKAELDANGHFYPVTTLSGAVLGQVRKRNLRRLKNEDGRWSYVRA
jgi:hypothetical protein